MVSSQSLAKIRSCWVRACPAGSISSVTLAAPSVSSNCSWLPLRERLTRESSIENRDLPILMCHGRFDPMIPITRAITGRETLLGLNFKVEWHEYEMGHQVCQTEIDDIARWLRGRFGG